MTEALEQLLPSVYRYSLWLCGRRDTAEELAQETFLRAWRRRNHLQDPDKARAWMYRIARNLWFDQNRRRAGALILDPAEVKQTGKDVPETAEHREELARALSALETLPERQRDVLFLFACEGLSVAEIAEVLSISPGAVKSSVCVARQTMRSRLASPREHDDVRM